MRFLAPVFLTLVFACRSDKAVATAPSSPATESNVPVTNAPQVHLLSGIHLSSDERKRVFSINRRYHERVMEIRAGLANPNGPVDQVTVGKLRTLRQAQLVEMRAAMSPANAIRFDQNRSLVDARLNELRRKFGRD